MKTGDESKLPVWAQQQLMNLRAEVSRLKDDLASQRNRVKEATGDIESPITFCYGCYVMSDDFIGLPHDARLRFKLGKSSMDYIDCTIKDDQYEKGRRFLELHSGRGLYLKPRVSNVMEVEITD